MAVDYKKPVQAFPTTQWSLVGRAGACSGEEKRQALTTLIQQYLPALQWHLVHIKQIEPNDAEDLLQGFLTDKVLEQDILQRADAARGRFRTFLLTSLSNFIANRLRDAQAAKRSPQKFTPLDETILEAPTHRESMDAAWAKGVLARSVERMKEECFAGGRPDIWSVFEARVLRPTLQDVPAIPYSDLIREIGFISPSQASNVLVTANRMFVRTLRAVVGDYVETPDEIEDEIFALWRILANGAS